MTFDLLQTGISQRFFVELLHFCSFNPLIERVILFGSRARGDFRPRSDIDLAIHTIDATHSQQNIIESNIQEMMTPLKIDVVFIDRLTKEGMLFNIQKEGVIIYEQGKDLREVRGL